MKGELQIITFTPDCGENQGGYYVEVGYDEDEMFDYFCVHPEDLGLKHGERCDADEARQYAENYVKENYNNEA